MFVQRLFGHLGIASNADELTENSVPIKYLIIAWEIIVSLLTAAPGEYCIDKDKSIREKQFALTQMNIESSVPNGTNFFSAVLSCRPRRLRRVVVPSMNVRTVHTYICIFISNVYISPSSSRCPHDSRALADAMHKARYTTAPDF